jgi:glycosyltransferase involved in cell wall biosynthesis
MLNELNKKVKIAIVAPSNCLQKPETCGGGYMRFIKVNKYLSKYFSFIFIDYFHNNIPKIAKYISAILVTILMSRYIRNKQINAVLVINETFPDILVGYMISKITKTKLLVFTNAVPLKGQVVFGDLENLREGLFASVWRSVSAVEQHKLIAFIKALALYELLLSLRDAMLIPLAPCVAANLKELDLKFVPVYPGVGCDEPSLGSGEPWVDGLYVASPLHPQKGVFDVIEVWRKIIKTRPDARMIIAGREDPLFNIRVFKEKIRRENIEKNITVIARKEAVPNSVILKLMSRTKVFVYPSRKDVCPLVIGEALSRGTPVVTYDLPGIQFAYGSCEAVIRVPVGDTDAMAAKVLEILENPQLAESLRQAAVDCCKVNPWSKVALKEAKAYLLSLLGAHGFDVYDLPFRDHWYNSMVKFVLSEADQVITVSKFNARKLLSLGVSSDKLHVIPNGYDERLFKPVPMLKARERLGLPQNRKILLSVGNLVKVKGHIYLISAMSRVLRERKDVLLIIVRTGSLKEVLQDMIKNMT